MTNKTKQTKYLFTPVKIRSVCCTEAVFNSFCSTEDERGVCFAKLCSITNV